MKQRGRIFASSVPVHSDQCVHRVIGTKNWNGMCISISGSPIRLLAANVGSLYVPVARSSGGYHQDSYVGRCQPLLPIDGENNQYTLQEREGQRVFTVHLGWLSATSTAQEAAP